MTICRMIRWTTTVALGAALTATGGKAASNDEPRPIAKIGSTVYVNIGALRCPSLVDLKQFKRFFHEDNRVDMDQAADRCLPDTVAETPEEESTGQRAGILEQRDAPDQAQCVREIGSKRCVWVMDNQVEINKDRSK